MTFGSTFGAIRRLLKVEVVWRELNTEVREDLSLWSCVSDYCEAL
jgi:hypothetical protein